MDQLVMKRDSSISLPRPLPDGYSIRSFQPGDEESWCQCCIDGELGVTESTREQFNRIMTADKRVELHHIYFMTSPDGRIIGTVTYQYGENPAEAYIHMVGYVKAFRGKGLSAYLLQYVVDVMIDQGVKQILLTTDDWRIPAIKSYLKCGFVPVTPDVEMSERWRHVIETIKKGTAV